MGYIKRFFIIILLSIVPTSQYAKENYLKKIKNEVLQYVKKQKDMLLHPDLYNIRQLVYNIIYNHINQNIITNQLKTNPSKCDYALTSTLGIAIATISSLSIEQYAISNFAKNLEKQSRKLYPDLAEKADDLKKYIIKKNIVTIEACPTIIILPMHVANAMTMGYGKSKCVILGDCENIALLKGLLLHEIGHCAKNHVFKKHAFQAIIWPTVIAALSYKSYKNKALEIKVQESFFEKIKRYSLYTASTISTVLLVKKQAHLYENQADDFMCEHAEPEVLKATYTFFETFDETYKLELLQDVLQRKIDALKDVHPYIAQMLFKARFIINCHDSGKLRAKKIKSYI